MSLVSFSPVLFVTFKTSAKASGSVKLCLILLFQECMLYKFKLGHNTLKTTKNICYANGEVAVDHSTISRWLKIFCSDYKNLDDQAKSVFEAVLQVIGANPLSSTESVSGKVDIS